MHAYAHTHNTPVKDDQCEFLPNGASYPPWRTHTQPNTHRPNPTGQHVRQRSENTFSTWLSNRAARGSSPVLVSAHPPSASLVSSKQRMRSATQRWIHTPLPVRLNSCFSFFICRPNYVALHDTLIQRLWLWQLMFTWQILKRGCVPVWGHCCVKQLQHFPECSK